MDPTLRARPFGRALRSKQATEAARLLNYLGGAQQNRWRYGKTKRRGGLAVHDHLVFHRKLHRELRRLRAVQNAIDITRCATPDVYLVGSVESNPPSLAASDFE